MNIWTVIILFAIGGFALLLLRAERLLNDSHMLFFAASVIALAMAVRVLCMDYKTLDYINFLSQWVDYFRNNGGWRALSRSIGNYNIPYLYFLALFSYIDIPDLYLIKLLSILFDVILAWSSMKLVGVFTGSSNKRLFTFLVVLFLPTVVLNGALWGQCDSIYTAFAVMSLWLALDGKPKLSMAAIAASFAFKLQAVFVMPIFLAFLYTGRIKFRHFFIFPLTYIVLMLPAVAFGRPLAETFTLYFHQAGSVGSALNYNSPSVFAYVRDAANIDLFSRLGIGAAFAFMSLVLYWLYIRREHVTDMILLAAALLLSVGIPFLLPHMHDRYFFMADILTLVFAVIAPRYFPLPLLTSFASLLGYHAYLKMRYLLPMSYGATALIFVISLVFLYIFAALSHRRRYKAR
ncbi:MAG TPA: conjugal transfer protein TraL [Clostridiales bacterium]|nr:conjugal transfer protein TraL [Clostridiales bacterium]